MINRYCGGNLNPWNIPATRVNKIKAVTIVAASAIAAATFTLALVASLGVNLHALNALSALTIYGSASAGLVSSAIFATALGWLITKTCHRIPPPIVLEQEWGSWDNVSQADQNDYNMQRVLQESEQTGNSGRIEQKKQAMQDLGPYFQGGVAELREYFTKDAVNADPSTLYQLTLIGLLKAFQANIIQNSEASFLQAVQAYCNRYLPRLNGEIQPYIDIYQQQWKALTLEYSEFGLINFLILQAVKGAVIPDNVLSISEDEYKENKREELMEALQPLADNKVFQNLYESLAHINRAIFTSDNELLTVVSELSGIGK